MLLNLKSILTTDWKAISLFQDDSVHLTITPYRIVTIVVAALVCMLAALFYRRFSMTEQLFHRQKLARMLENGWYESESTQDSGFFKDLPATTRKEKITYFPKVYYRMEHGLYISVLKSHWGKYQEQLYTWKKTGNRLVLWAGFQRTERQLCGICAALWWLRTESLSTRYRLNMAACVWWKCMVEYDKPPYMLIAGGTQV